MRPSRPALPARAVLALALGAGLAATALPAASAPVPLAALLAASGAATPGAYVVVLRAGTEPRGLVHSLGVQARHVYEGSLAGFAAQLTPGQLERVRRDPAVESVEPDQVVRVDGRQPITASSGLYGLDRIDQRALPLSGSYTYRADGAGVQAYVIDTGLAASHADFGGRARNVHDATGGTGTDCNGHGTHVAGILGGAKHGVAKAVRLRGVRVLGCDGSGSTSDVISAVQWVTANAVKPAVANLSLSGGYSSALNRAVAGLSSSGVLVAVAAGNDGGDACSSSPASAAPALTTAASSRTDSRATFSASGSCVDTYAPGVDVTSTWLGGGTRTLSGTSMASPHVAGVAALYKATYGETSSPALAEWVRTSATRGKIKGNVTGTTDRLLFTGGL